MISLYIFTNCWFECQRNNIKAVIYKSAFLDNVCSLCFFVVPNELGITPVDREVRCYPDRISAFTLLRVCMIVPGPLSLGNLKPSSCTQRGKFCFSRKESCPGLKPSSGRYENQTSNRLAFILLLLGACMLRRWKGVCKEWVGSPVFQFASGLCSPVEHALSHPGHYSC